MAFSAHLVNLGGYTTSRPPLFIFTLCLIAFALTTLWLSYFVGHEENVPNYDIHSDWKRLLNHLSNQELCLSSTTDVLVPFTNSSHSEVNDMSLWSNVSFTVTATLDFPVFLNNVSYAQGIVSVTDWRRNCDYINSPVDAQLGVAFSIPSLFFPHNVSRTDSVSERDVCVTLFGPRYLLPMNTEQPACHSVIPLQLFTFQNGYAHLTSRSSPKVLGQRVDDWCRDGIKTRLVYKDDPSNSVFLTLSERSVINLHLVHTSYLLFVMAITLICYAIFKGRPKKLSVDKVPLDP